MDYLEARNDALQDNGPQLGDRTLSDNGSSWLFAVTAIFILSLICMRVLSFKPFNNEKIFHYLFTVALFVGVISYYASASGLAYVVVQQANQASRGFNRQIYWTKYVFWVVAFPVVVLSMGLMSGVSWATIAFNIALTWIWIISFLVGAFTQTNYKWGFFIFGLLAFFYLVTNAFVLDGRRGATRVGTGGHHTLLSGGVGFLWFMYILGWALTDGGNVIGVTGSWIWFGILDLLLIPVVGFAFVFLSRRWDFGAMNLHFTQYGRVARGADMHEKSTMGHGAVATGAGLGAGAAAGGVAGTTGTTTGHHTVGNGYNNAGPTTGATNAGYGTGPTTGAMDTGYGGTGPTTGPTTDNYGPGGYNTGPTTAGTTTAGPGAVANPPPGQQYV